MANLGTKGVPTYSNTRKEVFRVKDLDTKLVAEAETFPEAVGKLRDLIRELPPTWRRKE